MLNSIPVHKCLELEAGEWRAIVCDHGLRNSMSSKHFSQLVNTVVAGGSRYHSNNFQTTLKRNLLPQGTCVLGRENSAGAKVWLAKAIGLCCIPSSDEWERTAPIPYGVASQARSKVDVSVLLAFSKCGCPCLSPLPRLAFAQKQIERRQDAGQIQNELCMIVNHFQERPRWVC